MALQRCQAGDRRRGSQVIGSPIFSRHISHTGEYKIMSALWKKKLVCLGSCN